MAANVGKRPALAGDVPALGPAEPVWPLLEVRCGAMGGGLRDDAFIARSANGSPPVLCLGRPAKPEVSGDDARTGAAPGAGAGCGTLTGADAAAGNVGNVGNGDADVVDAAAGGRGGGRRRCLAACASVPVPSVAVCVCGLPVVVDWDGWLKATPGNGADEVKGANTLTGAGAWAVAAPKAAAGLIGAAGACWAEEEADGVPNAPKPSPSSKFTQLLLILFLKGE